MNRLDIQRLSFDEQHILVERVLPGFKRWMMDYPLGSSLFEHGLDGVIKWGAENDGDIRGRYEQYLAEQMTRRGDA